MRGDGRDLRQRIREEDALINYGSDGMPGRRAELLRRHAFRASTGPMNRGSSHGEHRPDPSSSRPTVPPHQPTIRPIAASYYIGLGVYSHPWNELPQPPYQQQSTHLQHTIPERVGAYLLSSQQPTTMAPPGHVEPMCGVRSIALTADSKRRATRN